MRSPSSPCTATRRPQLRPTAIPPREARATLMVRAHTSRAPLPTPSARKADSHVDGPRTSRARRCPPPVRRCPHPPREAGTSHFFAALNRGVFAPSAAGTPPYCRMFHVKHLFLYRTTLRQLFHVKQSRHQRRRQTKEERPPNGGGRAELDFAAKGGFFSRSIFQTASTARPRGKAVAAFPSVVKATVEAGQVGWKAGAAKRSVLVELR